MRMSKHTILKQFNDDLTTRNYMALLACILNPKLSHNKALKLFDIADRSTLEFDSTTKNFKKVKNKLSKDYRKIKVIDIFSFLIPYMKQSHTQE